MSATKAGEIHFYEFTVTRSTTMLVAARDIREARRVAGDQAWDALDDCLDDGEVDYGIECEADDGFVSVHADEIPYAEDGLNPDKLTVAELMELAAADPPPDESRGPVHWCEGCLHEPVQFDWREDRQLCGECRNTDALAA